MGSEMKDILSKLSSYNIFNYLFPGVIFAIFASKLTHYNFVQQNIFLGAFFYYFIGLVISRFGSLAIEPILKKTSFLKFADYKNFIAASKMDDKIELLSEVNNTYRTLCSLFTILLFVKIYEAVAARFTLSRDYDIISLVVILLILFLYSYKKQTSYIKKRVQISGS